ncbi:MAG TPA: helix-turn-helix domain-containing protein [Chloroflexota bacterium]|nr:helix-turn-helix domain-containing protein [Chloroflexota bacterium]
MTAVRSEELCPRYCRAIEILGKRWTCLILSILLQGPHRFSELEHSVPGIGGRMLTERLKDLESHGILKREARSESAGRVEYSLTSKGYGLRRVIAEIQKWADEWDQPLDHLLEPTKRSI